MIFAKTFIRDGKQILIRKDYDTEDDMYSIDATIDSGKMNGYVTVSAKYHEEEPRDAKFDEIEEGSELFESFFKALTNIG